MSVYAAGLSILGLALIGAGSATLTGVDLMHRWVAPPAIAVGASLLYLGACYAFRRRPAGWAILPYSLAAITALGLYRVVSREPFADEIAPRLWLGSAPLVFSGSLVARTGATAVLNVTAEFGNLARLKLAYKRVAMLDGVAPTAGQLSEAAAWAAEQYRAGGVVLVHCAQGHGRSATTMAKLLLELGIEPDPDAAIARVSKARPGIKIGDKSKRLL